MANGFIIIDEKDWEATQSLVNKNIIVCPPISVYDGTFAIEKLTENDFGGEVVASIEPPEIEGAE